MRYLRQISFVLAVLFLGATARAQGFLDQVNVEPLRYISIQDSQTLKTYDTFARQRLTMITGKTSWEGKPAMVVILDMACRPEQWTERNVIKVKSAPLRQDFERFEGITVEEKKRIVKEGTVSLAFLLREDVHAFLEKLSSQATFKERAVQELWSAGVALQRVSSGGMQLPGAIIAPVGEGDRTWKETLQVYPNTRFGPALEAHGQRLPETLAAYAGQSERLTQVIETQIDLIRGWRDQDARAVNAAATTLAKLLPAVNPAVYPSELKRKAEVIYNGLAKLTIPGAFVYFIAFTLYLISVYSGVTSMRKWALGCFALAFVVHTVSIGIRWWLVSKSVGNWFESIPIKNQFESVMFSAWFGALVGLVLELWRGKGIWGTAACFVGWLSLVAIFSAPFVTGKEIGGEIGMVNGVLMSYWLYIHVTMVTASYALIGMSFMLGAWWLLKYYFGNPDAGMTVSEFFSDDDTGGTLRGGGMGGGGFSGGAAVAVAEAPARAAQAAAPRRQVAALTKGPGLQVLDACNLVILQLAFWVLGVGIILGAVWADQSWGRPWGWDPKETFALVTWIIYLAVVHVRLATGEKAWWTAVLSIVGFVVMLFNWIGVNFFLVGLHSYA